MSYTEEIREEATIGCRKLLLQIINSVDDKTVRDEKGKPVEGFGTFLRIRHCEQAGCSTIDNWEILDTASSELIKISRIFMELAEKRLMIEKKHREKRNK